ncbi:outer membrane beta-barrel protein [Hymenobacter guriensis]|uniref:Outer membrane beta-barrel protein n=1 Tax=Hymenobacter guriensis TaxID=2793065 RepID=A0ABS0L316_9BACT|nr:outer membrane beta-barrel protein [Hymenobacter guriensis]MBG8554478.1 outer membrane beta-barrel protein [Hymenobacter guriensis]
MRRSFLFLLLLSSGGAVQAQISAGTTLLSGAINYSSRKQEATTGAFGTPPPPTKESQFSFSPTAGYFVADNLALGLMLTVSSGQVNRVDYDSYTGRYREQEINFHGLAVGPMVRYYKFLGDNFAFYGQVGAGYSSSGSEMEGSPIETSNKGVYAALTPGLVYFPVPKVGLEVTLNGIRYASLKEKTDYGNNNTQEITNTGFDFGLGVEDVNLGISFYLGR